MTFAPESALRDELRRIPKALTAVVTGVGPNDVRPCDRCGEPTRARLLLTNAIIPPQGRLASEAWVCVPCAVWRLSTSDPSAQHLATRIAQLRRAARTTDVIHAPGDSDAA